MIQGVLLGVLLAGGPGAQFSITYETRIDEDGRLVCAAVEEESDPAMLRQGPSSRDDDIQVHMVVGRSLDPCPRPRRKLRGPLQKTSPVTSSGRPFSMG